MLLSAEVTHLHKYLPSDKYSIFFSKRRKNSLLCDNQTLLKLIAVLSFYIVNNLLPLSILLDVGFGHATDTLTH